MLGGKHRLPQPLPTIPRVLPRLGGSGRRRRPTQPRVVEVLDDRALGRVPSDGRWRRRRRRASRERLFDVERFDRTSPTR